jgi:hypothetical protein
MAVESDELGAQLPDPLDEIAYQLGFGPLTNVRCAECVYARLGHLCTRFYEGGAWESPRLALPGPQLPAHCISQASSRLLRGRVRFQDPKQ